MRRCGRERRIHCRRRGVATWYDRRPLWATLYRVASRQTVEVYHRYSSVRESNPTPRESLTLPFNGLGNLSGEATAIHGVDILERQNGAVLRESVCTCAHIHRALERVAFPTEDIVRVLTEARPN